MDPRDPDEDELMIVHLDVADTLALADAVFGKRPDLDRLRRQRDTARSKPLPPRGRSKGGAVIPSQRPRTALRGTNDRQGGLDYGR